MKKFSAVALLVAAGGLLAGCDNTRANPAERVTVETPSRHSALAPGVAPTLSSTNPPAAPAVRSDSYTEDFDADGTIDSRSTATRSADDC